MTFSMHPLTIDKIILSDKIQNDEMQTTKFFSDQNKKKTEN